MFHRHLSRRLFHVQLKNPNDFPVSSIVVHHNNNDDDDDESSHIKLSSATKILHHLADFLSPLLPLANACPANFFTRDHWRRIPEDLTDELEGVAERGAFLSLTQMLVDPRSGSSASSPPTPNLFKFISSLRDRSPSSLIESHAAVFRIGDPGFETSNRPKTDGKQRQLDSDLSFKKAHELAAMADCVERLKRRTSADAVVDVGCGVGHLTKRLRVRFDVEKSLEESVGRSVVVGIDKNPDFVGKIEKSEEESEEMNLVGRSICAEVKDAADLARILDEISEKAGTKRSVIGALHACGGLSSVALQCLVEGHPRIRGLCVVGCCYHKLKERPKRTTDSFDFPLTLDPSSPNASSAPHFPMSHALKSRDFVLGQNARMLASQPPDRIWRAKRRPHPRIFSRAVFDVLIQDKYGFPAQRKKLLKNASKRCRSDIDYLKMGLETLDSTLPPDEELEAFVEGFLPFRNRLLAFHQLRTCLSPVVESLVLLDRFVYLLESKWTTDVGLIRLFDPIVSPRCFALVAWKK